MADKNIAVMGLVLIALFGGMALASAKSSNAGFDEYGYNERASLFQNCWTNYLNWKFNRPVVECPEDDLQVHIKWHFDKDNNLDWLINLFYNPVTGEHVLKRYVTIDQEACAEAGGRWLRFHRVTQTGEIVPVCEIMEVTSGEGVLFVATPAGFGVYQEE